MRFLRQVKGLAQEDFGVVSSRTYVSTLERELKQPTLTKVDELAAVLGVHPLTLLALSYCPNQSIREARAVVARLQTEIDRIAESVQHRAK
jgi:transcriptional regulator with XRE-family HTH domain